MTGQREDTGCSCTKTYPSGINHLCPVHGKHSTGRCTTCTCTVPEHRPILWSESGKPPRLCPDKWHSQ